MRLGKTLVVVVITLYLAGLSGPAVASEVLAGHDLFETPPGGWVEDVGGGDTPDPGDDMPPLPADHFGPGSDPFEGQVTFQGDPPGMFLGQPIRNADTIVERLVDTALLGSPPHQETIPIEIVALSLQSTAPITVTYSGTNPELWDVAITLSGTAPSQGSMTIAHEQPDPGGGIYASSIVVCPLLTFTR